MKKDILNLEELKKSKDMFAIFVVGYMYRELEERNRYDWMEVVFIDKEKNKDTYTDIKNICNKLLHEYEGLNNEVSHYITVSANKLLQLIKLYEEGKVI